MAVLRSPRLLRRLFASAFPARDADAAHVLAEARAISKLVRGVICRRPEEGGTCKIYFVGAYHSHAFSSILARTAVDNFKPSTTFLELCREREHLLWSKNEMAAAAEAARIYGAEVILGDQVWSTTKARIVQELGVDEEKQKEYNDWETTLLPDFESPEKYVERCKRDYPNVHRVMFEERDRHMAEELIQKVIPNHRSVVAVVGAGHIPGLVSNLQEVIC